MDDCFYTCIKSWPNRVSCDCGTLTSVMTPPALTLKPPVFVSYASEGPAKRASVSTT